MSVNFVKTAPGKRLVALLLAAAMLLPGLARAEDLTAEWMEHAFRSRDIVGGAVVVSRYGEPVFTYAYGSKSASRMEPVTLDTCFRVASVTKMVTAVGVMKLYERGAFALDDPISDLLPFRVVNSAFKNDPITVRQILSHTSGVIQSQHTGIDWDYVSQRNTEHLFLRYARPGTRYHYSNINGSLFGALIEAVSGQSLNTFMRENVFDPLGMNAAYDPTLLPDPSDISNQMSKSGTNILSPSRMLERSNYEDTCDPMAHLQYSVGGLYASARGLDRIGAMLCEEGRLNGARVLNPGTVRLMQADQRFFPGSSVTCVSEYGLGIRRFEDSHGNTWYGHQGIKDGLSSDVFYLPDKGLSVTVIANGYTQQKLNDLVAIASLTIDRAAETDWNSK